MNATTTPPGHNESQPKSRSSAFWFALRMIEVRLRFVAVLVALGLIIGYWDTIQNYWDRWTRPAVVTASHASSVTEYYCPMDPSVVRPGLEPNGTIPKCPICGMPLSLRKKGAPMVLPPGVVGRVSLSPNRVKMAGIRTSQVAVRPMSQTIRTVGTVVYDESRQSQIVSRVSGYVEELMVDNTFVQVQRGDPLAEIYSPELYAAVQELKVSRDIPGSRLPQIAREKIRLLGIDTAEIDELLQGDDDTYRVIVRSPASGYVIQKKIQQGATVTTGQMLFEIADLSSVWIEADVYERDLALLQLGQEIEATVEAYPGRVFTGRVGLIYPELNAATRTNRVRFEVTNEELLLRAGMYATVNLETPVQEIEPFQSMLVTAQSPPTDTAAAIASQDVCPVTGAKLGSMGKPLPVQVDGQTVYLCCAACEPAVKKDPQKFISRMQTVSSTGVLSVPETAVIDTGDQTIVYVEREPGVYEGVEVQLGPKSAGYYAVVSGLLPGDQVAAAGAFLIDAETRLNPAASASYFGASGGPSNSTETSGTGGAVPTVTSPATPAVEEVQSPQKTKKSSGAIAQPELNFASSRLTAEQRAEIAKLPPADQQLALEQVLCPITKQPLGSMGVPPKVMLAGEPVFLCCQSCARRAEGNAAEVVQQTQQWRAANRGTPSDAAE